MLDREMRLERTQNMWYQMEYHLHLAAAGGWVPFHCEGVDHARATRQSSADDIVA